MRPLNIAFFSDVFLPKTDGVGVHIYNTSIQLARMGHRVFVVAPQYSLEIAPHLKEMGIDFYPVKVIFPSFLYPQLYITKWKDKELEDILRDNKVDLIHFHTPFTIGWLALNLASKLRKPLFATYHTFFTEPEYLKVVHLNHLPLLSKILWKYSIYLHNRCICVICPTHYTLKQLKGHRIKTNVEVVNNGIPLDKFSPQITPKENIESLKKKYNLSQKFTFLYVGRLSLEKNLHLLIRAFIKFLNIFGEGKLLIVGDGPIRRNLENFTKRLRVEKSVIFLGKIENKRLPLSGIYQVSRAFVSLSTSETQNISAIEAMAMGLPLVVANSRGTKELVEDNGFCVNTLQDFVMALKKLTEDQKLYQKMSQASLQRSLLFNIENTSKKLIELYYKYNLK